MNELSIIILYSYFSGATILLGGGLAWLDRLPESEMKETVLHGIVAFGGGILISAVAFVLAPKSIEVLSVPMMAGVFFLGSIAFFLIDRGIERCGGMLAQLMAMMMDFIPEAIALGAVFAQNRDLGLLLAVFIGLQNLPESFNAYNDLIKTGLSARRIFLLFLPLSFSGVLAACGGYFLLAGRPLIIAALMGFSGGGLVYLTFQDIAPLSRMRCHWSPALGASLGFLVGMLGKKLIG